MSISVEVCVDNFESLRTAERAGADRIELCSSLVLGGLTPSNGFIQMAVAHATIPVYAMVRPRQGDFYYSEQEVEIMLKDIYAARLAGAQGVVLGVLDQTANIDRHVLKALMGEAGQMGVTFHRAIDLCVNLEAGLETIIEAGCERILTSGQAKTALAGSACIAALVAQARGRISVMAGAGISHSNVNEIISKTEVADVHLSAKTTRRSLMTNANNSAQMGSQDESELSVTSEREIRNVVAQVN